MQESIDAFYQTQFEAMPEMKGSYDALLEADRKSFPMGEVAVMVQHNPARERSTAAKVSAEEVAARPCFLCRKNRPEKQLAGEAIPDFEILINPFPILPVHFTIVSKEHTPQSAMPLEMIDFVSMMPLTVAFFNGAGAGASAPDHLHFQAVRKDELPLLAAVERLHTRQCGTMVKSTALGDFPMSFLSFIVPPDFSGMQLMSILPTLGGIGDDEEKRRGLVNTLVWIDSAGLLRVIIIPRKAHRPACYFDAGDNRMMVSPGALDMAGLIVTPRRVDFDRITPADIQQIYSETGLTPAELDDYCSMPALKPYLS